MAFHLNQEQHKSGKDTYYQGHFFTAARMVFFYPSALSYVLCPHICQISIFPDPSFVPSTSLKVFSL